MIYYLQINLVVPPAVLLNIHKNVQNIERIAQKLNIQIPSLKKIEFSQSECNSDKKNQYQTLQDNCKSDIQIEQKRIKIEESTETIKDEAGAQNSGSLELIKERLKNRTQNITSSTSLFKCDEFIYKNNSIVIPSTTSINSRTEDNQYQNINNQNKVMYISGGDYKYGYKDIITGTFDEKLNECISNGIQISFNDKETNDFSLSLYEDYIDMTTRPKYKKYMEFREKLPTYKKSTEILNTINNNQVVVISGETGCGKSTQVLYLV